MIKFLDVVSKFLDFLNRPSGLGVFVLVCILALLFYVVPLLIVGGLSYDNTNRLERANKEGTAQVVNAIQDLKHSMRGPVATARDEGKTHGR